ncbi:MAG: mechanosensitive ion channel [Candidatus Peribacteria bacterium]|nr:MAG: mechanosensitive ion channel [Candidatus Peribacteria bacterium]
MQIAIIPDMFQHIVDTIFKVSFIISALFVSHGLIKNVFNELKKNKKHDQISKQVFPMISNILIVFMWVIGGLTILGNLGYNITALITGAGIGGLALALAAQKSVSNIFGAISIIINKPFKVGDFIRINDYTGTVKQIGLTYLEIKDLGGNKILIPNENLISSAIENLTERENRRTDFSIGVVYETTLVKLKK